MFTETELEALTQRVVDLYEPNIKIFTVIKRQRNNLFVHFYCTSVNFYYAKPTAAI